MPPLKNLYSFYIDNQHKLYSYSSEEECDATMLNSSIAARSKIDMAHFYVAVTIDKKAISIKNSILAYTIETIIKYRTIGFFQFNCLYL